MDRLSAGDVGCPISSPRVQQPGTGTLHSPVGPKKPGRSVAPPGTARRPGQGRLGPVALGDSASAPVGRAKRPLSGQFSSSCRTPLQAIRDLCLECVCGQRREVELCPSTRCPLYDFRFGVRPETALAQGKRVNVVRPARTDRDHAAEQAATTRK